MFLLCFNRFQQYVHSLQAKSKLHDLIGLRGYFASLIFRSPISFPQEAAPARKLQLLDCKCLLCLLYLVVCQYCLLFSAGFDDLLDHLCVSKVLVVCFILVAGPILSICFQSQTSDSISRFVCPSVRPSAVGPSQLKKK